MTLLLVGTHHSLFNHHPQQGAPEACSSSTTSSNHKVPSFFHPSKVYSYNFSQLMLLCPLWWSEQIYLLVSQKSFKVSETSSPLPSHLMFPKNEFKMY